MTDRQILMSTPMVRAILARTKRQTRRVAKGCNFVSSGGAPLNFTSDDIKEVLCPYGQPGDRLHVRETFFAWGRWETRFSAKKGRDEWHFIDMTLESGRSYAYNTDEDTPMLLKRRSTMVPLWWKRPAIFMPRAACRITLEITGVRVERLQNISEADAVAEGSFTWAGEQETPVRDLPEARLAYRQLWEEINGPGSWDANPFVWCVSFSPVEMKGNTP